MVANWIELPNPGADENGRVVVLREWRTSSAPQSRSAARRRRATAQVHHLDSHFTATDHASFATWAEDPSHGYARLQIEQGVRDDGTWESYALVYVPGQAWSSWGVRRRDDAVEVWRCSDGKTVSRHEGMVDALTSLPHPTVERRASNALHRDRRCRAEPPHRIGRDRDRLSYEGNLSPR